MTLKDLWTSTIKLQSTLLNGSDKMDWTLTMPMVVKSLSFQKKKGEIIAGLFVSIGIHKNSPFCMQKLELNI